LFSNVRLRQKLLAMKNTRLLNYGMNYGRKKFNKIGSWGL